MDEVVSERSVGPVALARALWRAVRGDRAARRIAAAGLALRLLVTGAVWTWALLGDGGDVGGLTIAVVSAVVIVGWMSASALTQVALIAALDARGRGTPLSARRAFALAWARRRPIAGWIVAVRGRGFEWWEPRSTFALPALATGDADDLDTAQRRSVERYRTRWGRAKIEAGGPLLLAIAGGALAFALALATLPFGGPVAAVGTTLALIVLIAGMTAASLARAALALAAYRDGDGGGPSSPLGLAPGEVAQLIGPPPGAARQAGELQEREKPDTIADHGHGRS